MKNFSILFKLVGLSIITSLITATIGYIGFANISTATESLNAIATDSMPTVISLADVRGGILEARRLEQTLLLQEKPTKDEVSRIQKMVDTSWKDITEGIKTYESTSLDEKEKAQWSEFKSYYEAWLKANRESLLLQGEGKHDQALALANAAGIENLRKSRDTINKIIAHEKEGATDLANKALASAAQGKQFLVVAVVICVVLSISLGLLITFGITRPIKKAVAMANGLANGDLSQRMTMNTRDEIGRLSRSLDAMADTISKLNANIVETAGMASAGHLRKTIDDGGFGGDYRGLISSINNWTKSMLLVIDKVPSPIMIRDQARNMRFVNVAGGFGILDVEKVEGQKCDQHFKTDDCVNGKCACDAALKSGKEEASTTVARPLPNVELDVSYKAIPLGDDAVFEFVTDQSDIMKVQRKVVEIAARAEQVALHVASASEEIAAQVEQCTRGAQEQSSRVGETATAMEEMNATVLEVAKNASQAADTADNAKKNAESGAGIVSQVVQGIANVQKQALALKANMTTLGEQAQGIGQIMNVINDIADQTNLLALNAAIEAARAGEAGRGFAVVADEVRKLAEKTMAATKQVGDAIHGIQDGTRLNISNVDQTVTTIEEATELATKSGDSLKEIVTLVDQTTDQVRSIAAASEQQSAASDEINRSIEDINRISAQTSAAMHESALAVGELAEQSQTLSSLIEEMQSEGGSAAGHTAVKSPRKAQPKRLALN